MNPDDARRFAQEAFELVASNDAHRACPAGPDCVACGFGLDEPATADDFARWEKEMIDWDSPRWGKAPGNVHESSNGSDVPDKHGDDN